MSTQRVTTRRGANHGLHLALSIITFGLWVPVWLIVAMVGRRETTTLQGIPPQYTQRGGQYVWDPQLGWVIR